MSFRLVPFCFDPKATDFFLQIGLPCFSEKLNPVLFTKVRLFWHYALKCKWNLVWWVFYLAPHMQNNNNEMKVRVVSVHSLPVSRITPHTRNKVLACKENIRAIFIISSTQKNYRINGKSNGTVKKPTVLPLFFCCWKKITFQSYL